MQNSSDYVRLRMVAMYQQSLKSERPDERENIKARLYTYTDAAYEYSDKRAEKLGEWLQERLARHGNHHDN